MNKEDLKEKIHEIIESNFDKFVGINEAIENASFEITELIFEKLP